MCTLIQHIVAGEEQTIRTSFYCSVQFRLIAIYYFIVKYVLYYSTYYFMFCVLNLNLWVNKSEDLPDEWRM